MHYCLQRHHLPSQSTFFDFVTSKKKPLRLDVYFIHDTIKLFRLIAR